MSSSSSSENRCVDTVRVISAAQPEAAKSGHPGAPMGCAPIAHLLYGKLMRFSPKHLDWMARDRFVLSNGHGCALQYTMLYLLGCGLTLEDLKNFRQLDSRTPGHPERKHPPGIEVTTGPLGQGIAQAVGLALADKMLAARYNRPDLPLFGGHVYGIVGDGCLQEGVSAEASSLAGHWGLGNLIFFYDSNGITIDGSTALSFTEDVAKRYEAYGWQVIEVDHADTDLKALEKATLDAKACTDKPTLIVAKTTIGYGSRREGSEKTHGAPLGADDIQQARGRFGLETEDLWAIEPEVRKFYDQRQEQLSSEYKAWEELYAKYKEKFADLAEELETRFRDEYTENQLDFLPTYKPGDKAMATRALSGVCLSAAAERIPAIVGGSADLQGSNSVVIKGAADVSRQNNYDGRYIRYGVREHAMLAITVGIASYGGFRPFAATFFNFISYAWPAVRLAALSYVPILTIATHDSIELGEDGPTHQPIEMSALCRATPNLHFIRPCDGNEVAGSYAVWLKSTRTPVLIALSRNAVPVLEGTDAARTAKGAYVLSDWDEGNAKKVIVASSGTEVQLIVEAAKLLRKEGFSVRVVSFPCWSLFAAQSEEYQRSVLPQEGCRKLYVEAAHTLGCERWFDRSIGMTTFGASAPYKQLWEKFGFTAENIAAEAKRMSQ